MSNDPSGPRDGETRLEDAARAAIRRAHAPYSGFPVGAALLTTEGEVVAGCNVENVALPLGLCAERVAIFSALARGLTPGAQLLIVTNGAVPTPPCGGCREVLRQLAPRTDVVALSQTGQRTVWRADRLLPQTGFAPAGRTRPATLIARKRDGAALSRPEIRSWVGGVLSGEIEDYQLTAFMMAVYWRGMDESETRELTLAMLESGSRLDLSNAPHPRIDKHSTGGVGDKVSLPLLPLALAAGLRVPMISGRGLGHTGGTLDKLDSIDGYRSQLPLDRLRELIDSPGGFIAGPTADLAPADRRLYGLRDVSAIVGSVPLIVSSILSKKLAAGLDRLVLDVKYGRGAFMPDRAAAETLARALVSVSGALGLPAVALVTRMDEPIGATVGNGLEVAESLEFLRSASPSADLAELVFAMGGLMLGLVGRAATMREGAATFAALRQTDAPLEYCRRWIGAQGGDVRVVDDPERLPISRRTRVVVASQSGYIQSIDALRAGEMCVAMGGGRQTAGEWIDPSVGLRFHCRRGACVASGDPLYTVHLPIGGGGEHLIDDLPLVTIGRRPPEEVRRIAALVTDRGTFDEPWDLRFADLLSV